MFLYLCAQFNLCLQFLISLVYSLITILTHDFPAISPEGSSGYCTRGYCTIITLEYAYNTRQHLPHMAGLL